MAKAIWNSIDGNNIKRRAGWAGGPCLQMNNIIFHGLASCAEGWAGRLHNRTGQWAAH